MTSRLTILAAFLVLTACGPATDTGQHGTGHAAHATRIVSLDYCADQYVLKFVERERILALSPDAGAAFSYMRDAAAGLRTIPPHAEDVLVAAPDLVVRSYGGGPTISAFLERAGIPVLDVGWVGNIADIKRVTLEMAEGLDEPERGAALVAEMETRLASLARRNETAQALYLTTSGATSGPGSLIHEMLLAAGLANFEQRAGWHSLPLERLAYDTPDLVAAASFEGYGGGTDIWNVMRHPVAQEKLRPVPTIALQGAWTSCGGWFLMDAIEALAGGTAQ